MDGWKSESERERDNHTCSRCWTISARVVSCCFRSFFSALFSFLVIECKAFHKVRHIRIGTQISQDLYVSSSSSNSLAFNASVGGIASLLCCFCCSCCSGCCWGPPALPWGAELWDPLTGAEPLPLLPPLPD